VNPEPGDSGIITVYRSTDDPATEGRHLLPGRDLRFRRFLAVAADYPSLLSLDSEYRDEAISAGRSRVAPVRQGVPTMTETPDARKETTSPGGTEPDEDRIRALWDHVMASHDVPTSPVLFGGLSAVEIEVVVAASIFGRAFLEALGKRAGDGVVDLITRIRQNGKTTEAEISLHGDQAVKLVVTGDLPDEARLALLDLDVTAEELRGRELRWDAEAWKWRPSGEPLAKPDETAHTD